MPESSAADVVARVLEQHGGAGLLVESLRALSDARYSPAKRTLLSRREAFLQVDDWRYTVGGDGRLRTSHTVEGVVIASSSPSPADAGRQVAELFRRYADARGPRAAADIEALLAGLTAAI